VCLLTLGVDITTRANLSVEEIIGSSDAGYCRHKALTAAEMMQSVPGSVVDRWSDVCRAGWDSLLHTLIKSEAHSIDDDERSQVQSEVSVEDWDDESGSFECEAGDYFHGVTTIKCTNEMIGHLWATIQAEFLTYRRTKITDPWISEIFQMGALRAWLRDEAEDFDTPLAREGMLNAYSKCGWFLDERRFGDIFATASDVCAEWFANMDDYEKATFVHAPDIPALLGI
jgi:hypothetical protein